MVRGGAGKMHVGIWLCKDTGTLLASRMSPPAPDRRLQAWKKLQARLQDSDARPGLAEDANHFLHCTKDLCARCKFVLYEDDWCRELQMGSGGGSWLASKSHPDGSWGVGCLCCSASGRLQGRLACFAVATAAGLQLTNLKTAA